MTYSVMHARTRLCFETPPSYEALGMDYPQTLNYLNHQVPEISGLFTAEYSPVGMPVAGTEPRKYFTGQNAGKIDGILNQLEYWEPLLDTPSMSVLRHDLIMAVNDVSNIAGTYGHYRSTFNGSALRSLTLQPSSFKPGRTDHDVVLGPAENTLSDFDGQAVYLDPPYKKRQYAANYHLLETIARGDSPKPVGISGLREWRDQYSDFCSKVRIESAFKKVFEATSAEVFFISYSEDGLIPESQMVEILSSHGTLRRFEIPLKRFKSNAGGKGGQVMEHLYVVHRS